ncbi:hypothetical protein [Halosimplex halobium]|uniref:hypothetical protein n=1 Tax=Halosimplex halobium TaxID=3396618 RepID=UPI003F57FD03
MTASLTGEVADVVADAEYRGQVYERTVSVSVGSAMYQMYQDGDHVTRDNRGESVDLVLLAQPINDVDIITSEKKGISQPGDDGADLSKWHTILTGEVVEIGLDLEPSQNGEEEHLLLDVGQGTVLIAMNRELEDLITDGTVEIGSQIQVISGRIDIVGRNDDGPV